MLIHDEVQHASAKSFKDIIDNSLCKYRVGVTATATRKDQMHFLFYDTFGEILIDIKENVLKDRITDFNFQQINTDIEFMIPNRTSYVGKGDRKSTRLNSSH